MSAEVKAIETKKTHHVTSGGVDQSVSSKKIQHFIADVKAEIQKITWTQRDELIFYTQLVVGATFLFGMAIYGLDLVIQTLLATLNFVLHIISG